MKIAHGIATPFSLAVIFLITGGCVTTKTPHLTRGNVEADAAADNVALGMAYMEQNNLQRAKEKLDRAMKENPSNPNVHSVYALFYERINDQKKAETPAAKDGAAATKAGAK